MESDATYLSRRANEERRSASKAVLAEARRTHLDMAARHEDLARAIRTHDRFMFAGGRHLSKPTAIVAETSERAGIWV